MYVAEEATNNLDEQIAGLKDPYDRQLVVSPVCVMSSAAGFYIGQVCAEYDKEANFWMYMPYDRASDYFEDKESAEAYLKHSVTGNEEESS
jgi:hypothetical protein